MAAFHFQHLAELAPDDPITSGGLVKRWNVLANLTPHWRIITGYFELAEEQGKQLKRSSFTASANWSRDSRGDLSIDAPAFCGQNQRR